ncbi:hypothetical protein FB107DRAFT_277229 [Schizophyllum commune]
MPCCSSLPAPYHLSFGAIGYCFGARHIFDLVCDGVLKVGAVVHSSHLEVHDDIERYAKTNAALFIESCKVDRTFPRELQAQTDAILGDGKFAPGPFVSVLPHINAQDILPFLHMIPSAPTPVFVCIRLGIAHLR